MSESPFIFTVNKENRVEIVKLESITAYNVPVKFIDFDGCQWFDSEGICSALGLEKRSQHRVRMGFSVEKKNLREFYDGHISRPFYYISSAGVRKLFYYFMRNIDHRDEKNIAMSAKCRNLSLLIDNYVKSPGGVEFKFYYYQGNRIIVYKKRNAIYVLSSPLLNYIGIYDTYNYERALKVKIKREASKISLSTFFDTHTYLGITFKVACDLIVNRRGGMKGKSEYWDFAQWFAEELMPNYDVEPKRLAGMLSYEAIKNRQRLQRVDRKRVS